MKKITVLIFVLALLSMNTYSYEKERALVNFSHEAAECGAYFLFVSATPKLDNNTVAGLRGMYDKMLKIAIASSNKEASQSRLELSIETMKREMKENWSNLSIINNKYSYRCTDFGKNIEGRMKYWLEKND